MAEHTRSSITIEATPAEVMSVIADFARYPEWTGEVKEAEVLAVDNEGHQAPWRRFPGLANLFGEQALFLLRRA